MADAVLSAYWIKSPFPHAPLGFGVTAWSLEDTLGIVRALDYGRYLPHDLAGVQITEGVTVADLARPHVVANMRPIAVRGMWYPFVAVGVPRWVEERRTIKDWSPRSRTSNPCSRSPVPKKADPSRVRAHL